MAQKNPLYPIPSPPGRPFLGNTLSVDASAPLQSLMEIARQQGEIFWLDMMGTPIIFGCGADVVKELCDESRFDKAVRGALRRVRSVAGDGLFTADTAAPNWSKAHHILMPTFSQRAMVDYFPMMADIAGQLCLKWERLNDDDEIDVVRDMTGLALDTIGVCGFDYRFNSFYRQDFHPFIDALTRTLETCMMQRGLPFEEVALKKRLDQLKIDVAYMNRLVDGIVADRKRRAAGGGGGEAKKDLLSYMLAGVDRETGERLSDENIRYQINTFLIAGHETTSGLLSFTLYFLLNNPGVLARAVEEVDRVLGRDVAAAPTYAEIGRLDYVRAVLSESLRLWPTAPAFSVYPYKDEIVCGKYPLKAGSFVTVLTLMLHRDVKVWGENAEVFNPENFSRERERERPAHVYKPFGNGQRACIGRQFAMQEAILVIAMILQRFELIDHSNYQLKIRESLSIKPDGFKMKVRLRRDLTRSRLVPAAAPAVAEPPARNAAAPAERPGHGTPLLVLYGSNLGAAEGFARRIAQSGDLKGFATTLAPLDDYAGRLPTSGAVVVATASYNGAPPDNAAQFVSWLNKAGPGAAAGVAYAVFGCGNRDWASTFQAVPRLIDEKLEALGAKRLAARAESDAREDADGQFQAFDAALWPCLAEAFRIDLRGAPAEAEPLYKVEVVETIATNPVAFQTGAVAMTVLANRELQHAGERSTRHIEIALPPGATYRPGDHLCVVPVNPRATVRRALARFGMEDGTFIRVTATGGRRSPFPRDSAVPVRRLAEAYGELQSVASRKDVATLARHTRCPVTKEKLLALAAPAENGADLYRGEVLLKRKSVLDLLEEFPACELPFGIYLEMIPWLQPRYYSISSSPRRDPKVCSITVGVVEGPARSGLGRYRGVCSNYLKDSREGDTIYALVKEPTSGFRLPEDPARPLIMIGPGTGLAPFRGFLQERAALRADGAALGPALLFYGCRNDGDYLYRDDLETAARDGLCELFVAFSRQGPRVYVQDLIRREAARIFALMNGGASVYICGDGARMEPDVRRALAAVWAEEKDAALDDGEAFIESLKQDGRYNLDVWAGG